MGQETNEINDIMNQLIRDGTLEGWRYFESPRRFGSDYGTQKGWERIPDVNEKRQREIKKYFGRKRQPEK